MLKRILGSFLLLVVSHSAMAANECASTPWHRSDRSCADLGLDTNGKVCLPGDRYATMCDDKQDFVRTCTSNVRCDVPNPNDCRPPRDFSVYLWDFDRCAPCPMGLVNDDAYGSCGTVVDQPRECYPDRGFSDYEWDFVRCRPCERGYYNFDARGKCERD